MPRRRRRPALATQRWSAEEFAGELADRVRRDLVWDEVELESSSDSDDARAFMQAQKSLQVDS